MCVLVEKGCLGAIDGALDECAVCIVWLLVGLKGAGCEGEREGGVQAILLGEV